MSLPFFSYCMYEFQSSSNLQVTRTDTKSLDGFEFRPNLTNNFGVFVPLSGEKNDVSSFSHSPLIRYLSNLQVRKTGVKARMSWNLGLIGLFTLELFALECGIYFPSLISGKLSLPSWAACYSFLFLGAMPLRTFPRVLFTGLRQYT